MRTHRDSTRVITGFSVSTGNPISARMYDKTEELRVGGREEKRAIEHARWLRAGWSGESRVTRVEFQHRGTFLDEVKLRDPEQLSSKLDAVWQRDTRWLRIVDRTTASRLHHCRLDPRWSAVQDVVFSHRAEPIVRERRRGGASPTHVAGAALSRLAAMGLIRRIDPGWDTYGEILDERRFVDTMTAAESEQWAREYVSRTFAKAGADIVDSMIHRFGANEAAYRLLLRNNATVARFSSTDDVRFTGSK